ncbi:MAG TPA: ParB N-terminal domain-containing protein, partial [Polyangiaceae bacterium]
MNNPPKRGLGRGLDALLSATAPKAPTASTGQSYGDNNVFNCPLDKIVPQKGQPRQRIDDQRLDELAQSIKEHGLLEPLVVRRRGQDQ